jgi:fatty-acyl-CoA synthase
MGLVGFCLSPMMGQVTVDFLATTAFARRPALWLKLMSDNQSTITYSPSFGYDLAARRINGDAPSLDLSKVRVAGIGGDMVRADVLDLFADTLSVAGFNATAFLPSYGMAETTLAISFVDTKAPVRVDQIDRHALKTAAKAIPAAGDAARSFVVCGRPMPGSVIEIRSETGRVLGSRSVGRIFVKSPSLMAGYYHNPSATSMARSSSPAGPRISSCTMAATSGRRTSNGPPSRSNRCVRAMWRPLPSKVPMAMMMSSFWCSAGCRMKP